MKRMLLILGIAAAINATAAPQNSTTNAPPQNAPSATTIVPAKNQNQFQPKANPNPTGKINRAGNVSSQPWPQIVGWHCGQSQFPTAENQQPQLVLVQFSWGK